MSETATSRPSPAPDSSPAPRSGTRTGARLRSAGTAPAGTSSPLPNAPGSESSWLGARLAPGSGPAPPSLCRMRAPCSRRSSSVGSGVSMRGRWRPRRSPTAPTGALARRGVLSGRPGVLRRRRISSSTGSGSQRDVATLAERRVGSSWSVMPTPNPTPRPGRATLRQPRRRQLSGTAGVPRRRRRVWIRPVRSLIAERFDGASWQLESFPKFTSRSSPCLASLVRADSSVWPSAAGATSWPTSSSAARWPRSGRPESGFLTSSQRISGVIDYPPAAGPAARGFPIQEYCFGRKAGVKPHHTEQTPSTTVGTPSKGASAQEAPTTPAPDDKQKRDRLRSGRLPCAKGSSGGDHH